MTSGSSCLGRVGRAERPESRADAAGENDGPAAHVADRSASSALPRDARRARRVSWD